MTNQPKPAPTGAKRMDEWEALQIADRIADYLFVNVRGEKAERLVLTSCDRKDLGGWGRRAVVDVIARELKEVTNG